MKTRNSIVLIIIIIALAIASIPSCSKESKEKVVVNGSTTVLPITQKAAEAFYEKYNIVISLSCTGS
ncbi:MAG: phosphate ABC transporter substrate-binding protein, partial [Spirochaetota bacterium]